MRVFALLLFIAGFSVSSAASDRQIGFVQQDHPGELVIVTVNQSKKKHVVIVRDFRADEREFSRQIPKEDFELLWSAFLSEDAKRFTFDSGNMSDVGFYTVKLVGKEAGFAIRLPNDQLPESLALAIGKIKSWIDEKG